MRVLGVIIATRNPGNPISWLFLLVGPAFLLEAIGLNLVANHPEPPSLWDVAILAGVNSGFFIGSALVLLLLYVFPTGHFLTRRWAWAGWVAAVLSVELLLVYLFLMRSDYPIFQTRTGLRTTRSSSSPQSGGLTEDGSSGFSAWLFSLSIVGAIPAVVVRYRRSSQTIRAQIRWVTFSFVVFVVMYALNLFDNRRHRTEGGIFGFLMSVSLAFIPIAITVAITRYRLFEIDRIISRTVGYALVVAGLGLVYVVGAVWLPTKIMGKQPQLFVAGSTLVVAALFNPVRRRVLSWVDRRFNRSQYDAQRVVDDFADRLQDGLDVGQLTAESVAVVTEVMQPAVVGVAGASAWRLSEDRRNAIRRAAEAFSSLAVKGYVGAGDGQSAWPTRTPDEELGVSRERTRLCVSGRITGSLCGSRTGSGVAQASDQAIGPAPVQSPKEAAGDLDCPLLLPADEWMALPGRHMRSSTSRSKRCRSSF